MEEKVTIISLSTDFGIKDGNVGVMKGVIWGIAPEVQIADLSHLIGPQNILEGALILGRSAPYFPEGSIHIMVVDPGVGTSRRPIAARLGSQHFVGPDNGLFTLMLERAEGRGEPVEIVHLDQPKFWLPEVSHVFHGRDIFSPAAAHLANGVPLTELGSPVYDPVRLELPRPQETPNGFQAELVYIDSFGNLVTNLVREDLGSADVSVRFGGVKLEGLVNTFGERAAGELVILYGSTGSLIISEVNGSAENRLGAKVGDEVEVRIVGKL
jgi:S-adenosyl-L-methionine hydrolase (adenosine-forming)